ncbi:hypothetical protein GCM10009601_60400 [Streptomyces thermospinosisporus]|uniref:NlpC/P60 domain-containing protein n=1 Tax=Streptomyces thermospinosisporus TaxID=161482 RepID=A0ABP4JXV2_9ACTN
MGIDRPELLRLLRPHRRLLAHRRRLTAPHRQPAVQRGPAGRPLRPPARDITYWYNNSQHNGLYIGHGKAIHAPRTGKNIEITNLASMPYFAATRP